MNMLQWLDITWYNVISPIILGQPWMGCGFNHESLGFNRQVDDEFVWTSNLETIVLAPNIGSKPVQNTSLNKKQSSTGIGDHNLNKKDMENWKHQQLMVHHHLPWNLPQKIGSLGVQIYPNTSKQTNGFSSFSIHVPPIFLHFPSFSIIFHNVP